jgi:hypothetical protein
MIPVQTQEPVDPAPPVPSTDGKIRLLLENRQAPGDITVLTATIRDLHLNHPGRFVTAMRTTAMELWENNPYLVPEFEVANRCRTIYCHYPLIKQSNQRPYHFLHGFSQYLGRQLGVNIPLTQFKGDIHLSPQELRSPLTRPDQGRTLGPVLGPGGRLQGRLHRQGLGPGVLAGSGGCPQRASDLRTGRGAVPRASSRPAQGRRGPAGQDHHP